MFTCLEEDLRKPTFDSKDSQLQAIIGKTGGFLPDNLYTREAREQRHEQSCGLPTLSFDTNSWAREADCFKMSTPIADILYLEDDADTHELVTFLLTQANHNVVAAKNFCDALLLARKRRFDLFLIDNWIEGGSGIELCKKLRRIDPATPILFYSGAAFEYDREEALAAGADGYLTKPAFNEELIEEISRLIQLGRRRTNVA